MTFDPPLICPPFSNTCVHNFLRLSLVLGLGSRPAPKYLPRVLSLVSILVSVYALRLHRLSCKTSLYMSSSPPRTWPWLHVGPESLPRALILVFILILAVCFCLSAGLYRLGPLCSSPLALVEANSSALERGVATGQKNEAGMTRAFITWCYGGKEEKIKDRAR